MRLGKSLYPADSNIHSFILMILRLITLSLSLLFTNLYAQADFGWAGQIGGSGNDNILDIETDASGSLYCTGYFMNSIDVDPSSGIETLTSEGGKDIFVSKTSSSGELLWGFSLGNALECTGQLITTDALGNIIVSGYFNGAVDFDPGPDEYILNSTVYKDIFIASYSADGAFLWAGDIKSNHYIECTSIAVNEEGAIHLLGNFQGTTDFDPGADAFPLPVTTSQDSYLLTLTSSGDFINCKTFGGSYACYGQDMAFDQSGSLYITGFFLGSCDFDPGISEFTLSSSSLRDGFVVKLNPELNFQWAQTLKGAANVKCESIDTGIDDRIWIGGSFEGNVNFDPALDPSQELMNFGSEDIFLCSFESSGDYIGVGHLEVVIKIVSPELMWIRSGLCIC